MFRPTEFSPETGEQRKSFSKTTMSRAYPIGLGANDGYGLSKWVAEQLVFQAHARGLPTISVRFGNIGWQQSTGIGNPLDFQRMMISACRQLGYRPVIEGWKFEVTPVDFAAKALLVLSNQPAILNEGGIFNCVQEDTIDAHNVFEWVAAMDGKTMSTCPFQEWVSKISELNGEESSSVAVKAFVLGLPEGERFFSEMACLDCSKFRKAISCEPTLSALNVGNMQHYYNMFLKYTGEEISNASPTQIMKNTNVLETVPPGARRCPLIREGSHCDRCLL